ncbi:MAG: hypothetical protein AAFX50_07485, partial [Acidobacteriota bacterium]
MPATPERRRRIVWRRAIRRWSLSALLASTVSGQGAAPGGAELPGALGPDRALLHLRMSDPPSSTAPVPLELVVSSAAGAQRYPAGVPAAGAAPADLEASIDDFVGTVRERRGAVASVARGWHRELGFDAALGGLPAGVDRLVLVLGDEVPGALRRLPFEGLLDGAGEPLATRYLLVHAGSVDAWLAAGTVQPAPGAVAIFAPDPADAPV